MRSAFLLFCCLGFTGLFAQLGPAHDPATLGFDPARLARIDTFVRGLVEDGVIPNAQTLVARRGQIVHRGTYGHSDLERRIAARPDDIYRIASQTKALMSVGLMMLYERGAFLLEDPIRKYLPAFAAARVLDAYEEGSETFTTKPLERDITIRHLLSHTAGIPYEQPVALGAAATVPFFASLEDESLEQVVDRIARRPLLHQPGEGFTYGLGSDVLGRLIEVLSGQPLDVYLREQLFIPLGMEDSYFYLPTEKHGRLVQLYSKAGPDAPLILHENETYRTFPVAGARRYLSAGAGSVGTIDDYARFCQLLLNGGVYDGHRLLNARTVALMTRNHIGPHEVWDRQDNFGLGFMRITEDSRYGDLAPAGAFTWGGLYCSEYTIDPENELILLIYTNVHPIPQYAEVVRKFRILVYQALVAEGDALPAGR